MKTRKNIEKFIKNAAVNSNPEMNRTVLNDLLKQLDKTGNDSRKEHRSIIMKHPFTKLAAAAVIIAVFAFGLFEFFGIEKTSGVVWAEVVKKVQGNTGIIYRTKKTQTVAGLGKPIEKNEMTYYSPKYGMKVEDCPGEEKTITTCFNFTDKEQITLMHSLKKYARNDLPAVPENQGRVIPEDIVKKILSGEYKELGRQTIEGVPAEGVEVDKSSEGMGPNDSCVIRLWVSVETGYPVMLETDIVAKNGDVHIEMTMDQFQWDVELDAGVFKVDIPPDYTPMKIPLP